jgi:hypothetical protein
MTVVAEGTQHWFTDRVFVVGGSPKRDGMTWIVTSAGESGLGGLHEFITVRRDGVSAPSDGPP